MPCLWATSLLPDLVFLTVAPRASSYCNRGLFAALATSSADANVGAWLVSAAAPAAPAAVVSADEAVGLTLAAESRLLVGKCEAAPVKHRAETVPANKALLRAEM